MSDRIEVDIELAGRTVHAANLYPPKRPGGSFMLRYTDEYRANPDAYPFAPQIPLTGGSFAGAAGLPGPMQDGAPDRWGRLIVSRRIGRNPNDDDLLLGVSDHTRQGALRYRRGSALHQHPDNDTPPLLDLAQLQGAVDSVAADNDDNDAYKLLLQMGTDSLGGARPKAAVGKGDELWMAKFTHSTDAWSVIELEAVTLRLAAAASITVPQHELVHVGARAVLLTRRFDRAQSGVRIGYISAMTLLGNRDGDDMDYLDIVGDIQAVADQAEAQLHQLFRRIVFSLAVNNTDDHGRNHGFLRNDRGWVLSPAFDINPNPNTEALRSTSIGGARERSEGITALLEEAGAFRLDPTEARAIVSEVAAAVSHWRTLMPPEIGEAQRRDFQPVFDWLPALAKAG
ncbi:type II toxin-antitoxin system HipA family toxin [Arthrobacter sp. LAPM80]|uniref:type II toxin-antitoxin system HipA family toxin n=1 Tax=Arthrobacter sp. LAPM80 TaxID=3141788 RepID=UPI00398AC9B6